MLNVILTFLGDGMASVFTFFGNVFGGGISVFYDATLNAGAGGMTEVGELLLLGALIGLALWGLNFVRSMIPFLR